MSAIAERMRKDGGGDDVAAAAAAWRDDGERLTHRKISS